MTDSTGSLQQREQVRVLITGANGFVGRHLIAELLSCPESCVGGRLVQVFAGVHNRVDLSDHPERDDLKRDTDGDVTANIRLVAVDVCDAEALASAVLRVKPHQIYHLAARASGADLDADALTAVNVEGTRNLLDAASLLGTAPRVLLVSTGYVYGDTYPARPALEDDLIGEPGVLGAYADSKLKMERVALGYSGLTVIARAFAHTGPGQEARFVVPAFARQLALMEVGRLPTDLHVGNLGAMRDMMDVRDVVRAYRLLMSSAAPGETYNVATGRPIPMGELLDRLQRLATIETRVVTDPARFRPADIPCSTGNPAKLFARTGWHVKISIDQTLADTLNYWRRVIALEGPS